MVAIGGVGYGGIQLGETSVEQVQQVLAEQHRFRVGFVRAPRSWLHPFTPR